MFDCEIAKALSDIRKIAGVRIRYRRGSAFTFFVATTGKSTFDVAENDSIITTFHSRDFIFNASQLVLNGETVTPEDGDEIEIANTGEIYHVLKPGGSQAWAYCDHGQRTIRVHTKQGENE